jgi:hypothetical protein
MFHLPSWPTGVPEGSDEQGAVAHQFTAINSTNGNIASIRLLQLTSPGDRDNNNLRQLPGAICSLLQSAAFARHGGEEAFPLGLISGNPR